MKKITVIITNCSTKAEAERLGKLSLKKRLAGCYDVVARISSGYFWPPRAGKIATGKGVTIFFMTTVNHGPKLLKSIRVVHEDKVPFLVSQTISVIPEYEKWLVGELK